MPSPTRPPRRIALVHPGALGDLVQALPAIGSVRAAHPDAWVTLVTGEELAGLARAVAPVDEVLAFDTAAAYHGGAVARARLLLGLAARLRRFRPDAVALFKASPAYALLAALSGAPVRVGLARGRGAALLTAPLPVDPQQHREDRLAAVARALGADPDRWAPARWPEDDAAVALLPSGVPLLGIAPGGARNVKEEMAPRRWPAERFAAVARAARAAVPGLHVVLLGGPGDRAEADVLRAALPPEALTDLVGRTPLVGTRAVLARLDAFLANDSGLLHVAATTPVPIVAVFGPSDPREACPRRADVAWLWEPAHETPCLDATDGTLRRCVTPCCIARVAPGAVTERVLAALARRLDAAGAGRESGDERASDAGDATTEEPAATGTVRAR